MKAIIEIFDINNGLVDASQINTHGLTINNDEEGSQVLEINNRIFINDSVYIIKRIAFKIYSEEASQKRGATHGIYVEVNKAF